MTKAEVAQRIASNLSRVRDRIAEVKRDQRKRGRFLGRTAPFGRRVEDDKLVPGRRSKLPSAR